MFLKVFSLSIYPFRFIYWTDCGTDAKIERAQLDGSERIIIVNKNIIWPTGIAIDYPAKRIYWADPKASRVESVNTDGRHRHLIKAFNTSKMLNIYSFLLNIF